MYGDLYQKYDDKLNETTQGFEFINTLVDTNSGSSKDQESTTDNKVQSKINKFNALIENIDSSKRIQSVITKSIENLIILIFGHCESSVDKASDSSEYQKSITKYSGNKVQTRINEFNALLQNIHSSKK
ncbi:hypothetical protein WA026_009229 [Henosepilachna vigintioctopunctata]|uniref:Uncharacterized protein n=1 Tax=Henosepilachna vigintioctopunctata TaxID=420089 RepID=A0AAW1UV81_9CUCU